MIPGVMAGQMIASSGGGGGGGIPSTIGEAFGGGYYIGDITVGADTYAVIMAAVGGENTSVQWRTSASVTSGTDSSVDGLSNTSAMDSAGLSNFPAGSHCQGYSGSGFSDWYMPAKDELALAWTNRASLAALSMSSSGYWSSTQYFDTGYYQDFGSGYVNVRVKTNSYRVRPVRRLLKP